MFYNHKNGISFRHLEHQDLDHLIKLREGSWVSTHSMVVPNKTQQIEWYNSLQHSKDNLVLVGEYPESSGDYKGIGIATFYNIDHFNKNLLIGGHLFKEYRRKKAVLNSFVAGLDFAFEILGMHRVYAEILETNKSSYSLSTKHLGMKIEGVKRQHIYKSGRWLDSVMLGLLREEWQNSDRVKSYNGCCNLDFQETT